MRNLNKRNIKLDISTVIRKSDTLGILASSLCFIHCLATPLIFITHTGVGLLRTERPVWWGFLDIVFLALSFIAIRWSAKNTSKVSIKYAFWIGWLLLLAIVANEKFHVVSLPEEIIYIITTFLAILHFYNRKYCRCESQKCCINKTT